MNLQDYKKWAEWDYRMEHPEHPERLPFWFYPTVIFGLITLYAICVAVETRDWLAQCDPIEVMVALWALVCAGLFLAGMIIAIMS